jgi:hypothetical protein
VAAALGTPRHAENLVGRQRQGLRWRCRRGRLPPGPLGPHRGLQLHQRLCFLRKIRLQPFPAGGEERIFDVSNLAELDRGRAVVLASGAPATLVRTMPWYAGPHKESVEASIRTYSPRPEKPAVPVAAEPVVNPWVTT